MSMSEPPVDDKAHIRHELDLAGAEWVRLEPEGVTIPDAAEYAFIRHTNGETYVPLRKANDPDGAPLVFDIPEWDAFIRGVQAGEFDLPT